MKIDRSPQYGESGRFFCFYLKKSGMDKNGKTPIMGRITVNRTMAQFSVLPLAVPALPRAAVQAPTRPAAGTKALNQAATAIWVNPQRLGC